MKCTCGTHTHTHIRTHSTLCSFWLFLLWQPICVTVIKGATVAQLPSRVAFRRCCLRKSQQEMQVPNVFVCVCVCVCVWGRVCGWSRSSHVLAITQLPQAEIENALSCGIAKFPSQVSVAGGQWADTCRHTHTPRYTHTCTWTLPPAPVGQKFAVNFLCKLFGILSCWHASLSFAHISIMTGMHVLAPSLTLSLSITPPLSLLSTLSLLLLGFSFDLLFYSLAGIFDFEVQ